MKLEPGKIRACEWEILLFWGFQYRWTERCRAIPGYTSLVCRKLTPTNSFLFSEGIYHLFPSYFPLILPCSSLPEFERRSQGSIRGDAKKFALERAQDFIVRFGLSEEFHGVEEPESRFKEVRIFFLACIVNSRYNRCSSCSKFTTGSRIPLGGPVGNSKVAPDLRKKRQRKVCLELWVQIPIIIIFFFHLPSNSCGCSCK